MVVGSPDDRSEPIEPVTGRGHRSWRHRPAGLLGRLGRSRRLHLALGLVAILLAIGYATRTWIADEIADYVTGDRAPPTPQDYFVGDATLRAAAEASRGTHGEHGAIRHVVNYEHQLLDALESPTHQIEGDVAVVEGVVVLQHDPNDPIGMPLLQLLEHAATAEIPIVKLDLKRDRIDPIMDAVELAVDRYGLDPSRVQFNADVFDGPGVTRDFLGGRSHLSFVDRRYNQLIMELELDDLVDLAERFPESRIVIGATTQTGATELGYTEQHLAQFRDAVDRIRSESPEQPLAFSVRGNMAVNTSPEILAELATVEDSYIAVWWTDDAPVQPGDVELLRSRGATFFDTGETDSHD